VEHVDVIIVGAGLSGVGGACHLKTHCPRKSFVILEGRERMGGTWDLFRYPGVRSDLVAIAQRLLQEQPTVQRAAFQIYDEYLKANHVEDGAASYGRALALVLSPQFHEALVNYRFGANHREP